MRGSKKTGYAIASETGAVEEWSLPANTTNQQAEPINKREIHKHLHRFQMCSSYPDFPHCHQYRAWTTYNKRRIYNQLRSNYSHVESFPSFHSYRDCLSHQTDNSIMSKENNRDDEAPRATAFQGSNHLIHCRESLHLPLLSPPTLDKFCPIYISSLILVATRILSHFFKPPLTL